MEADAARLGVSQAVSKAQSDSASEMMNVLAKVRAKQQQVESAFERMEAARQKLLQNNLTAGKLAKSAIILENEVKRVEELAKQRKHAAASAVRERERVLQMAETDNRIAQKQAAAAKELSDAAAKQAVDTAASQDKARITEMQAEEDRAAADKLNMQVQMASQKVRKAEQYKKQLAETASRLLTEANELENAQRASRDEAAAAVSEVQRVNNALSQGQTAATAIAREIKMRAQRFKSQAAAEKVLLNQLEKSASNDEQVRAAALRHEKDGARQAALKNQAASQNAEAAAIEEKRKAREAEEQSKALAQNARATAQATALEKTRATKAAQEEQAASARRERKIQADILRQAALELRSEQQEAALRLSDSKAASAAAEATPI
jgi:hypothetical protein